MKKFLIILLLISNVAYADPIFPHPAPVYQPPAAAVVDANGKITNLIVANAATDQSPYPNTTLVQSDGTYAVGGTYINGVYTPPPAE